MMIGGALGDDAIKPDDLVTEMGKPLLQAAREGCNAELAQVVRSNGLTLANSLKDPEIADRLSAVIEMSPARMPIPVFLATGLADKLIPPATPICRGYSPMRCQEPCGLESLCRRDP